MSEFRTRRGKITLKGGAEFHLLSPRTVGKRREIMAVINEVFDSHASLDGQISGFAFVLWDEDGSSSCAMDCTGKPFPSMLAPDFVRNRLMASKIVQWAEG